MRKNYYIFLLVLLFCISLIICCCGIPQELIISTNSNFQNTLDLSENNLENSNSNNFPTPEINEIIPTATSDTSLVDDYSPRFSELEGIKIFFATSTGINYVVFSCGNVETNCIEYRELIRFDQITSFDEIHCPSISPGEDQLAFGSSDFSPSENSDLYLYDLLTEHSFRLTETPDYIECGATWSPDGRNLAVMAHREAGGHSYIYIINPNGCCQQMIPDQARFNKLPTWSPNGEYVAFISGTGFDFNLFVYDLQNNEVAELVPDLTFKGTSNLFWSPDGEKIAVYANLENDTDICIVDIEADDYFCLEEDDYIESLPSWSFDGTQLLYSAYNRESETHEIFQFDLNGICKFKISTDGEFYNPIWLQSIFFISTDLNDAGRQLWLFTIDGSWQQQLTFDSGGVRLLMVSFP